MAGNLIVQFAARALFHVALRSESIFLAAKQGAESETAPIDGDLAAKGRSKPVGRARMWSEDVAPPPREAWRTPEE